MKAKCLLENFDKKMTGTVLTTFFDPGLFTANEDTVSAKGSFADTMNAAKKAYMAKDLARFVRERDVKLNFPANHPKRSVLALRVLLYLSAPNSPYKGSKVDMWKLSQLLFRSYWVDGVDISNSSELAAALSSIGVSEALILEANENEFAKNDLIARTQEAVDRELFGVPSFFVTNAGVLQERLVYGQDQLELLEKLLGGSPALYLTVQTNKQRLYPVTFLYDFASPYTYLTSLCIDKIFGTGVQYVPVLIGAIFKGVGQHNTPAETMSVSRQKWASTEIFTQLSEMNAPFNWASRFPLRTLLPLRFSIAAGPNTPEGRKLIEALFKAFWVDDQDSNDPEVCIQVANSIGLDGRALCELANSAHVKEALHKNTSRALSCGVFGLPTVRFPLPV